MNLTRWLLVLTCALPAAGNTFFSPVRSTLTDFGVTIANAHQVDAGLFRGMLPVAYDQLKNQLIEGPLQITDILIIDSNNNDNVIFEMETLQNKFQFTEAKDTSSRAPRRYFYQPLNWDNLTPFAPNCRQYVSVLRLLGDIRREANRRVYFHCTVGEDRTGAVAALYRLLNDPGLDLGALFHDEMCERGYEAGDRWKGAPVVKTIRENLTPFFLKLAYQIKAGRLSWESLDERLCDEDPQTLGDFVSRREFDARNYECQASSLSE